MALKAASNKIISNDEDFMQFWKTLKSRTVQKPKINVTRFWKDSRPEDPKSGRYLGKLIGSNKKGSRQNRLPFIFNVDDGKSHVETYYLST